MIVIFFFSFIWFCTHFFLKKHNVNMKNLHFMHGSSTKESCINKCMQPRCICTPYVFKCIYIYIIHMYPYYSVLYYRLLPEYRRFWSPESADFIMYKLMLPPMPSIFMFFKNMSKIINTKFSSHHFIFY